MHKHMEKKFNKWCKKHKIDKTKRAFIRSVLEGSPSRRVESGKSSCGVFPSFKNGEGRQFEGIGEYRRLRQLENDRNVTCSVDQPPPFLIHYKDKNGRNIGTYVTADEFTLNEDGTAGYEECKPLYKLREMEGKYPGRIEYDEETTWHDRASEAWAEANGVYHRIIVNEDLSPNETYNLELLDNYLLPTAPSLPENQTSVIIESLKSGHFHKLADLFSLSGVERDTIYGMIARNEIYVDLTHERLTEPSRVYVFLDKLSADSFGIIKRGRLESVYDETSNTFETNDILAWDGVVWKVKNPGIHRLEMVDVSKENGVPEPFSRADIIRLIEEGVIVRGPRSDAEKRREDEIRKILDGASDKDRAVAVKRYGDVIRPMEEGRRIDIPERTAQRYWKAYREAEVALGSGYVGLLPKYSLRGNRTPRFPEQIVKVMDWYIRRYILKKSSLDVQMVRGLFKNYCDGKGWEVSKKAFTKAVKTRVTVGRRTKIQYGDKAAMKFEIPYQYLDQETPIHGGWPFHICHIDHSPIDMFITSSETGRVIGKAVLTLLVDAFSRKVLAKYVSFEAASYRSCMMVLRECARRHGRLPQIIVCDWGTDFRSADFEAFLAWKGVTKMHRKKGKPRGGSIIERLFGLKDKQFIHNLPGNTKTLKEPRKVSRDFDPANDAIYTLAGIDNDLSDYFDNVYGKNYHGTLGQSPQEAFDKGLANVGTKVGRETKYDEAFQRMSLPTLPRTTAKVHPGQGLRIDHTWYWSQAFNDGTVENTSVTVKYDPWDISFVWARVGNKWVKCRCNREAQLRGRTWAERKVVTEELRKKYKNAGSEAAITEAKVAKALLNSQRNARRAVQERENKVVRDLTNQTPPIAIVPAPAPAETGNDYYYEHLEAL
jgi:putative transposase